MITHTTLSKRVRSDPGLALLLFPGILLTLAFASQGLATVNTVHSTGLELPGRIALSRMALIGIATTLLVLAARNRWQSWAIVRDFFMATAHPMNLAIYRIVLFGTIFADLDTDYERSRVIFFSGFPSELQVPPAGLEWILPWIPINPTLAEISCTLTRVFSMMALLGIFSRTSALMVVVMGLYALGLPQFYGQVNHYHHMLWFAALLAVSRCGDMLSLDAIVASWKRADRGTTEPPPPSRQYALPLRFVWLLMGLIYFFPGFWKAWRSGIDWAFSDNFKYQLYLKWHQLDGWTPVFRLDQYPTLYKWAALGAIVFEMSFVFLIFFPRLRIVAAVSGLLFHNMTNVLMRIAFYTLQTSYVSMFDWHRIFGRVGRWLYRKPLYVVYDGNCKLCRRTVASIRVFDIFGRITYINALDDEAMAHPDLLRLNRQATFRDMYAVTSGKSWAGFYAYRKIATRIPFLWLILPILYVRPVPQIGSRIYRAVADSRACSIVRLPSDLSAESAWPSSRLSWIAAVGIVLFVGNLVYSIKEKRTGWPFTCYPPFSRMVGPHTQALRMEVVMPSGEKIPWDASELMKKFSYPRFASLATQVIDSRDPARLEAFWNVISTNDTRLRGARSVRIYRDKVWTIPERRGEDPIDTDMLWEKRLGSRGSADERPVASK